MVAIRLQWVSSVTSLGSNMKAPESGCRDPSAAADRAVGPPPHHRDGPAQVAAERPARLSWGPRGIAKCSQASGHGVLGSPTPNPRALHKPSSTRASALLDELAASSCSKQDSCSGWAWISPTRRSSPSASGGKGYIFMFLIFHTRGN